MGSVGSVWVSQILPSGASTKQVNPYLTNTAFFSHGKAPMLYYILKGSFQYLYIVLWNYFHDAVLNEKKQGGEQVIYFKKDNQGYLNTDRLIKLFISLDVIIPL